MLREQVRRLDQRTDSILASFDSNFGLILTRAQVRTTLLLRGKITIGPDGMIQPTAKNLKYLRDLPAIFRQALSSEGYDRLVTNFMTSFNGGLPIMDEILAMITNNYKVKQVDFTKEDAAYFKEIKNGVAINLEASLDHVAILARQSAMSTVGGTAFDALAVELAGRLHMALGQASTIAATGISTFYRSIAKQGFIQIEDSLEKAGKQLEYTYVGPGDKLTRPFCMHLLKLAEAGKTWTRQEIEGMDNEQLPDVFRTCGGYNCRHQWMVALEH